ncbi:MAG TPA: CAP domain-containing protein [Terracidiphilus sp.]|nr:CAP domain-containing protein [Terracidiphilus sp.]
MKSLRRGLFLCLALGAFLIAAQAEGFCQDGNGANIRTAAEQLFALANQARAQAGAGPLQWDPALAAAALAHCRRMVAEGPIAHRYGGELDLSSRAGQAGAHFGLIEENVAVGPTASMIHDEWMNSPGHRSNLLNPEVDHVGIAVVAARGVLYSVADYSRAVQSLSASQVEAHVAALIRVSGVSIVGDPSQARAACAMDQGVPRSSAGLRPGFIMRWQSSELDRLPQALVDRLGSGQYSRAAVGSCRARGAEGSFTVYRVAVLLY